MRDAEVSVLEDHLHSRHLHRQRVVAPHRRSRRRVIDRHNRQPPRQPPRHPARRAAPRAAPVPLRRVQWQPQMVRDHVQRIVHVLCGDTVRALALVQHPTPPCSTHHQRDLLAEARLRFVRHLETVLFSKHAR
jgi:hypothetical protein